MGFYVKLIVGETLPFCFLFFNFSVDCNYNWLSFRVVIVVVIFSVSPFSWPFEMDVIIDLAIIVFETVSVVSLKKNKILDKIWMGSAGR